MNFETVYYIESPDYNLYMDAQQKIYLELLEAFEKEHIEFAYPTQTLFAANSFSSINEQASNNLEKKQIEKD
jgi:small-conductance mechanosensitive channel